MSPKAPAAIYATVRTVERGPSQVQMAQEGGSMTLPRIKIIKVII